MRVVGRGFTGRMNLSFALGCLCLPVFHSWVRLRAQVDHSGRPIWLDHNFCYGPT